MIRPSQLLRNALLADAAASGVTGLAMAFAWRPLAGLLQLPDALLWEAGLFSIFYAALIGWMASRATLPRGAVLLVIVGNALWTLASAALLAGQFVSPNPLGYLFVGAQAAVVGAFAELQFIGLRRSDSAVPA